MANQPSIDGPLSKKARLAEGCRPCPGRPELTGRDVLPVVQPRTNTMQSSMVAAQKRRHHHQHQDRVAKKLCCDVIGPAGASSRHGVRRQPQASWRCRAEREGYWLGQPAGPADASSSPRRVTPYCRAESTPGRRERHQRNAHVWINGVIRSRIKKQNIVERSCLPECPLQSFRGRYGCEEMCYGSRMFDEAQQVRLVFESEKQMYCDQITALNLKIQDLLTSCEKRSFEDRTSENTNVEGLEKGLFEAEVVTQLMDKLADSQAMLNAATKANYESAEAACKMKKQLMVLEEHHSNDEIKIKMREAQLVEAHAEYIDKTARMSQHIEALESQRQADRLTIGQHRHQLAAINGQQVQQAEARRRELERLEQIRQDSQREILSLQQTVAECRQQLGVLQTLVVRQRECLECSICLGTFVRPVTLNCSHTFCEACIETSRRTSSQSDRCPLCRQLICTASQSAVICQLTELTQGLQLCDVSSDLTGSAAL